MPLLPTKFKPGRFKAEITFRVGESVIAVGPAFNPLLIGLLELIIKSEPYRLGSMLDREPLLGKRAVPVTFPFFAKVVVTTSWFVPNSENPESTICPFS